MLLILLSLVSLVHVAEGQGTVTSDPVEQQLKPDQMFSFTCTFTGATRPTWIRINKDGTENSYSSGVNYADGFTYTTPVGNSATLTGVAKPELNETMYRCSLIEGDEPFPSSQQVSLYVYGVSQPPDFLVTPYYNSLLVTWAAPWVPSVVSGIILESYEIQVVLAPSGMMVTTVTINVAEGIGHKVIHHGQISPNKAYKISMRAKNTIGFSEWSPVLQKMTPVPNAPSAPKDLSFARNINGGTPSLSVTWMAPEHNVLQESPVDNYTVYYKKGEEDEASSTVTGLTFAVPGVELGAGFKVSVTATNTGGESARAAEMETTVKYLLSVAVAVNDKTVNASCTIEITDVAVKCSVSAVGSSMTHTKAEAVDPGTSTRYTNVLIEDLMAGTYNITAKVVNMNDETLEADMFLQAVTIEAEPSSGTTAAPTTTTASTPSTAQPTRFGLSQVEMGIAAGAIGAFLLAVVMVPVCIFACAVCCMSKSKILIP